MDSKLFYFSLLVVALVVGYLLGQSIAKRSAGRWPGVLLALTGGIAFLVSQVGADFDHRFRLVAIVGLCFQIAGIVSSVKRKRTLRERSVDLWAPQK
jgi:hypothetical protein